MKGFLLLFLMAATSCTSIYLPNAQNVPTFKEAKEFQGNAQAQIFLPPFAHSFQAQAAYSLTNHVGVAANYSYSRTTTKGEGQLGEFGIGYYTTTKGKNYFSAFLGSGLSSSEDATNNFVFFLFGNPDPNAATRENATRVKSNYTSWFIQPSYGLILSNHFNLIISMKSSLINFENTYYGKIFILSENHGPSYHFEPSATLKINFDNSHFSFIGQGGIHLTNDKDPRAFTNFIRLAVGVQWRFLPSLKKSE